MVKHGTPDVDATRNAKILVVAPGADFSTKDVGTGLVRALMGMDVQIGAYDLTGRIAKATGFIDYMYRTARRNDPTIPKPEKQERLNRIFDEAGKDILNMALDNQVDGVLIISCMFVPAQVLWRLKMAGVVTGLVLTEAPYDDARHVALAPLVDIVWTNERTSVPRLREVQPETHYLAAAYDPATHAPQAPYIYPGDEEVPSHDVVFVGTAFQERVELLAGVDWAALGVDLGLYGNWSDCVGQWRSAARRRLEPYIRGGLINNRHAANLYRKAKIGLNLYRSSIDFQGLAHIDAAESMNPRAYELAACGCCTISNGMARLEEDEVLGLAVRTFHDADGLAGQVRYLLDNPEAREWCRGIALTNIQPHTFEARARQLMAQFEPVMSRSMAVAYG